LGGFSIQEEDFFRVGDKMGRKWLKYQELKISRTILRKSSRPAVFSSGD
jgi:hypothetical protein